MYIWIEKQQQCALVIDPHENEQALDLLEQFQVKKVLILLTHEHFDHTSGVNWMKDKFESTLYCHKECATAISKERNNRPLTVALRLKSMNQQEELSDLYKNIKPYACKADQTMEKEYAFIWCENEIKLVPTPGHTKGSICIEMNQKYVFTGDSLIPNIEVITRFPGGNRQEYEKITLPYLLNLDENVCIMPGHGKPIQKNKLYFNQKFFQMKEDIDTSK